MRAEDLGAIRVGAEMQSMKPYMDFEIEGLKKAVVSFVLGAINNGTLTPEIAFAKWTEYASYVKLQQKIDQRIRIGQSAGQEKPDLDFIPKVGYTSNPTT